MSVKKFNTAQPWPKLVAELSKTIEAESAQMLHLARELSAVCEIVGHDNLKLKGHELAEASKAMLDWAQELKKEVTPMAQTLKNSLDCIHKGARRLND